MHVQYTHHRTVHHVAIISLLRIYYTPPQNPLVIHIFCIPSYNQNHPGDSIYCIIFYLQIISPRSSWIEDIHSLLQSDWFDFHIPISPIIRFCIPDFSQGDCYLRIVDFHLSFLVYRLEFPTVYPENIRHNH